MTIEEYNKLETTEIDEILATACITFNVSPLDLMGNDYLSDSMENLLRFHKAYQNKLKREYKTSKKIMDENSKNPHIAYTKIREMKLDV